jgi:hypothetical protein
MLFRKEEGRARAAEEGTEWVQHVLRLRMARLFWKAIKKAISRYGCSLSSGSEQDITRAQPKKLQCKLCFNARFGSASINLASLFRASKRPAWSPLPSQDATPWLWDDD